MVSISVLIIIGLLAVDTVLVAVVALRRPKLPLAPPPSVHKPAIPELSADARAHLEQVATTAFEAAVHQATERFGHDLGGTSERLNQLIIKLTTNIVEQELEQYKQSLEGARTAALKSFGDMQQAIEQQQKSLQTGIDTELDERRQYLLDRLDHKLGAAVATYMVEALGQGADVGAQRRFLLESLERHKADLKKELSSES